jgi:hypothetical protein
LQQGPEQSLGQQTSEIGRKAGHGAQLHPAASRSGRAGETKTAFRLSSSSSSSAAAAAVIRISDEVQDTYGASDVVVLPFRKKKRR